MNATSKTCTACGTIYHKRYRESWAQWQARKGCSIPCSQRAIKRVPVHERVLKRSTKLDTGCWIWQGAKTPKGVYGVIGVGRRENGLILTHRAMHEHYIGPIPEAYEVDHTCRVTLCVNPDHLEAVTKAENLRRQQAAITHCLRGHAFTAENTYHPPSIPTRRQCRKCIKIRSARITARRSAARHDD